MNTEHPKWNFKEFSAFLMLYAASADFVVTVEEKDAILRKVDEATFTIIEAEYNTLNDAQKIELILSYKGLYFPTASQTNELLALIKSEFLADGEFNLLEQNLYRILKKLL